MDRKRYHNTFNAVTTYLNSSSTILEALTYPMCAPSEVRLALIQPDSFGFTAQRDLEEHTLRRFLEKDVSSKICCIITG